MAEVRLVGWHMLELKTARTTVTLKYEGGLIHVNLYDIELREEFSFTTYDRSASRDKLEALINRGVGADAEYLRLLQEIRNPETQAEYFAKFANGELSLKELQKVAKLSRAKKFDRETLREYRSLVIRLVQPVVEVRKEWDQAYVAYCKTPEYHLFLVFRGLTLNGESSVLKNAIFVSEFGAKELRTKIYSEYAIYKYLLEADRKPLEKWLSKGTEYGLGIILGWLRREEENGTLQVIDEELYAFLKSVLSLQIIAC
jgi:hypothetical protein